MSEDEAEPGEGGGEEAVVLRHDLLPLRPGEAGRAAGQHQVRQVRGRAQEAGAVEAEQRGLHTPASLVSEHEVALPQVAVADRGEPSMEVFIKGYAEYLLDESDESPLH